MITSCNCSTAWDIRCRCTPEETEYFPSCEARIHTAAWLLNNDHVYPYETDINDSEWREHIRAWFGIGERGDSDFQNLRREFLTLWLEDYVEDGEDGYTITDHPECPGYEDILEDCVMEAIRRR